MSNNDINRIKVVLVEKKQTSKWLADKMGKDPAVVSKWCTNTTQPSLKQMMQIAKFLNVDINELLRFDALPEIEKKNQ